MSAGNKEDSSKKYALSAEMFENISNLNEHEDEKAGRILEAMAFLSITAVTAFAIFVTIQLSAQITVGGSSFNLIPLSFAGFSVFVALGIFIFLEASLSGIETNKKLQTKTPDKTGKNPFEPQSLFYFKKISEEKIEQWTSYFEGNADDIVNKAYRDHVLETFSISKKTKTKVKYYKFGKLCFYIAIVFFVILIVAGCYALG